MSPPSNPLILPFMGVLSFLIAAGLRYFAFEDTVIGEKAFLEPVGLAIPPLPRNPYPSPSAAHAAHHACRLLNETLPGVVAFPGSHQFTEDVEHWTVSSEQNATCSVEPRSPSDVSRILKLLGEQDVRAPFAIKSGGHGYNPGQSSTPGVQISMSSFADILYDEESGTVEIGVGLTWDQVYERLEPMGIMVAGGRIPGIGVGGLSLGGGYSWKTNQYGLTVDTIVAHNVVLPSGQRLRVSNTSHPDLFFGLKGGLNNFGIVTSIIFEAHPQTHVYGGILSYSLDNIDAVNHAVAKYSLANKDPKSQILVSYASIANQFMANIFMFYDAPALPQGMFEDFFSIPSIFGEVKSRSFVDFLSVFNGGDLGIGSFGIAQHSIPIVQYTQPVLKEIVSQIMTLGEKLTAESNGSLVVVSVAPEPLFQPNSHSRGGAFPHSPDRQLTQASPFIAYQVNSSDPQSMPKARREAYVKELKQMTDSIQARAVEEGQSRWDDVLYPNYALIDTPLELLYGSNVQRLRALASKYDPTGLMSGFTGGFHFT